MRMTLGHAKRIKRGQNRLKSTSNEDRQKTHQTEEGTDTDTDPAQTLQSSTPTPTDPTGSGQPRTDHRGDHRPDQPQTINQARPPSPPRPTNPPGVHTSGRFDPFPVTLDRPTGPAPAPFCPFCAVLRVENRPVLRSFYRVGHADGIFPRIFSVFLPFSAIFSTNKTSTFKSSHKRAT